MVDLAKLIIIRLVKDGLVRNNLTTGGEEVLKALVKAEAANATVLSKTLNKSRQ